MLTPHPVNTKPLEAAIRNLTLLGVMVPFSLSTGIPPMGTLATEFGQQPAYVWYYTSVVCGYIFVVGLTLVLARDSVRGKPESSSGVEHVESLSAEMSRSYSSRDGPPL